MVCVALERCLAVESSMVLPTHCDAVVGSLLTLAEKQLWRKCVPSLAALVFGAHNTHVQLVGRLAARDVKVYALDWRHYLAHLEGAAELDVRVVSQNPVATNADCNRKGGGASSGRWRMQREKKQRRWQGICSSEHNLRDNDH